MKFLLVNRIAPDGTPRFAASHLGLFGLPMSHEKGRQAYMGKDQQIDSKTFINSNLAERLNI